jgi:hypothetical protein
MSGFPKGGFDPRDPTLFLHDLDPGARSAGFVRTDRAALSAAPFLDHRWRAANGADATAAFAELHLAGAEPPRIDFIWHTSHCASTLLATCLDSPGRCLALKEPRALVILAALKRSGHHAQAAELARSVFGLLGRRFQPDERILIKPSDSANTLVAEAAALTQGRSLLLYSDCESFVLSMARQGRAGFAHVRERFRSLAADGHPVGRWPAADLLRLTDLELAALVWRMQMDALETASIRLGDRALSLDCRVLLDDPASVLPRIDAFFGMGLGRGRLGDVAAGPLFRRDAKRPNQAFDARARESERAELRAHLGPDLLAVLRAMQDAFPRPPRLAAPVATATPGGSAPSMAVGLAVPAA